MQRTVQRCRVARMEVRSAFCGACESIVWVCVVWMCKCSRSNDVQQNCLGRTAWPCHIDDDWVTSTNINELVETKIGFNGIDMPDGERVCVSSFSPFFLMKIRQIYSHTYKWIQERDAKGAFIIMRFAAFLCIKFEAKKSMLSIKSDTLWNREKITKNNSKPKQKASNFWLESATSSNDVCVIYQVLSNICTMAVISVSLDVGRQLHVSWEFITGFPFQQTHIQFSIFLLFMPLIKRIFSQNGLSNWNPK